MTQFDKSKFVGNEYVTYNGEFVARFKRGGRVDFLKFLVKNFTVEEYFKELENLAPLEVLELKGYVTPVVKKILKTAGYPETLEGRKQYIADQIKKRNA